MKTIKKAISILATISLFSSLLFSSLSSLSYALSEGESCSPDGKWEIKCLGRRGPCTENAGVALPYRCEGGKWVLKNPSGECDTRCATGETPKQEGLACNDRDIGDVWGECHGTTWKKVTCIGRQQWKVLETKENSPQCGGQPEKTPPESGGCSSTHPYNGQSCTRHPPDGQCPSDYQWCDGGCCRYTGDRPKPAEEARKKACNDRDVGEIWGECHPGGVWKKVKCVGEQKWEVLKTVPCAEECGCTPQEDKIDPDTVEEEREEVTQGKSVAGGEVKEKKTSPKEPVCFGEENWHKGNYKCREGGCYLCEDAGNNVVRAITNPTERANNCPTECKGEIAPKKSCTDFNGKCLDSCYRPACVKTPPSQGWVDCPSPKACCDVTTNYCRKIAPPLEEKKSCGVHADQERFEGDEWFQCKGTKTRARYQCQSDGSKKVLYYELCPEGKECVSDLNKCIGELKIPISCGFHDEKERFEGDSWGRCEDDNKTAVSCYCSSIGEAACIKSDCTKKFINGRCIGQGICQGEQSDGIKTMMDCDRLCPDPDGCICPQVCESPKEINRDETCGKHFETRCSCPLGEIKEIGVGSMCQWCEDDNLLHYWTCTINGPSQERTQTSSRCEPGGSQIPGTSTITGQVTGVETPGGQSFNLIPVVLAVQKGLAGVKVSVISEGQTFSTITDKNGKFTLQVPADFQYTLIAEAPGFKRTMTVLAAEPGMNYTSNIALEKGEKSQTGGKAVVETTGTNFLLLEGWNLINLPLIPSNIKTAKDVVTSVAKQGGYVTTVARWQNGKWEEFIQRGANQFGFDFEIEPGVAYFLRNHKEINWIVAGKEISTPLPLDLQEGWNGIGIPYSAESLTASRVLDSVGLGNADTISRWESGLWDALVKRIYSPENIQEYGNNFSIESTRGYMIRLNKEVKWTPYKEVETEPPAATGRLFKIAELVTAYWWVGTFVLAGGLYFLKRYFAKL